MDFIIQVDELAEWLRSFGWWAILISVLLNILISILGVVPTLFLSGANAVVFGFVPALFISLLGEAVGAAVAFLLYRAGFGRMKQVKNNSWVWLQKLNDVSRKRRATILLIARLMPFVPSGLVTFAASVSQIKMIDFVIITILGKAPSIALETLVGHDLIRMNEQYPRLLITLLGVLVIYLLFRKSGRQ